MDFASLVTLLLLALALAIQPWSVLAAVLLVTSEGGVAKAVAFAAGWVLALTVVAGCWCARAARSRFSRTLQEVSWGPGNTGFRLGGAVSIHKGAIVGKTFTVWSSDKEDKARDEEMKTFTITAAKAWVRELLEANDWKVGGIGALFG